ncbi:MAG: DUF4440 domain-containing protein [Gammaproteobacteria bacterium]|nr:DUF4440 domain-containing protein [Gammaproteobacteria bacterium]MDH4255528.1 DUF4440 domain-containing protein [Gammaproteobacteria bacterium]MDH5311294.1 DUF4440 domain-containing protein [Gammaproteobacteria bacterium]
MHRSVLLLVVCCVATNAYADAERDVRCREIGFSKAAEARDAVRFASFIDSDARFVGGEVARGTEAVVAGWAPFFEENGPELKWRPQFVEVLEDGRLALSRGPYRLRTKTEDGSAVEGWGTFNSIWRLHDDGQWRVVFDAGSQPIESPTDDVRALLDTEVDCAGSAPGSRE